MLYDPRRDIGVTGRVLLYAADLLERHGWCQGYQRNEKGEYCAKGAIMAATDELGLSWAYAWGAHGCLREHLGRCIVMWNDKIGTTKEQVVAALRAAAFTGSARDE